MFDRFGRPFLKMRYVINDECNYFCIFCHFEGQKRRQGVTLTAEDYDFVTGVFTKLGISDFKITGGEPLLRSDVGKIAESISKWGGSVSITTNGYLLRKWLPTLRKAGVRKVNISLHTPDPDRYAKITGTTPEVYREVVEGLRTSKTLGIDVKINVVVLKGINTNRDTVRRFINLALETHASLQFIELMPTGLGLNAFSQYYEPIESIVEVIKEFGAKPASLRRELHLRPIYTVAGVVVELIKNYNNPTFCSGCTTMRLTSDGKLKTCIYAEPSVDLAPHIKNRDVEGVIHTINAALRQREPKFKFYSPS